MKIQLGRFLGVLPFLVAVNVLLTWDANAEDKENPAIDVYANCVKRYIVEYDDRVIQSKELAPLVWEKCSGWYVDSLALAEITSRNQLSERSLKAARKKVVRRITKRREQIMQRDIQRDILSYRTVIKEHERSGMHDHERSGMYEYVRSQHTEYKAAYEKFLASKNLGTVPICLNC